MAMTDQVQSPARCAYRSVHPEAEPNVAERSLQGQQKWSQLLNSSAPQRQKQILHFHVPLLG